MTKEEVTCKNCSIPLEYHGSIEFYCARIEVLGREIDRAKKERDNARRIACETLEWGYIANMNPSSPFGYWRKHVAEVNGWDCYDEEETP